MEPESSLPYSQVPTTTTPYPEPTPSSPHNPLTLPETNFTIMLQMKVLLLKVKNKL